VQESAKNFGDTFFCRVGVTQQARGVTIERGAVVIVDDAQGDSIETARAFQ
jgi:hypothetical protein